MVPVHEGYGEVLVEFEGGVGVVDQQGAEETVGVLTHGVGVVPVGSWAVGLLSVSSYPFSPLLIICGREAGLP